MGRWSTEPEWACAHNTRRMSAVAALSEASAFGTVLAGEEFRLCDEGLEACGGTGVAFTVTELLLEVAIAFGRGCRYTGGRNGGCAIFESMPAFCHLQRC